MNNCKSCRDPEIVWETREEVLFTILKTKQFGKGWSAWAPYSLKLWDDSMMVFSKGTDVKGRINLSKAIITQMGLAGKDLARVPVEREVGLHVLAADDVTWRCILPESQLETFLTAVKSLASVHNIDNLQQDSFRMVSSELTMSHVEVGGSSVMRRAVAKAMDKYDTRSRNQQIVARRGAFKFLPVYFANDLVHGSWWFVIGSIFVVISSSIVLANGFDSGGFLGDDSTGLSDFHYRATWFLILVSGVMFTLGSLAFVRAMYDPPIPPWFPEWYHLQNDELVASWLFLLGVVPLLPYCFIFLVEANTNATRLLYLVGVFFSALLLIGAYLFVRSCYPTLPGQRPRCSLPAGLWVTTAKCCLAPCLCIREKNAEFHLANDWLAGCWLLLWITVALTMACGGLTIDAASRHDSLLLFIYITSFFENIMFVLGCAYFVSGSYPSGGPPEDETEDYVPLSTQHGNPARSLASGLTGTAKSGLASQEIA